MILIFDDHQETRQFGSQLIGIQRNSKRPNDILISAREIQQGLRESEFSNICLYLVKDVIPCLGRIN